MELIKQELAEFEFRDIKFTFRTKATLADKLAKDRLLAEALRSKSVETLPRVGREIIKMFLVSWEGVTMDGKPVPYSFDTLENGFPAEMADLLMPALIGFAKSNVDILK